VTGTPEDGKRHARNWRLPRARKRFGQHFLEPAWVAKLIASLSPAPNDVFLEIGPGRGALTKPLAARVGRLIAVEIDRDLAAALPAHVPAHVRVVQGDFLDVDLGELLQDEPRPVRVVGNLPYNVSSPILFRLLHGADEGRRLSDATLMLQKEVADRLVATPGTADYGSLSLQIALLADVERLLTLPPGAFRPPPKVTSTVVRLTFRSRVADVGDPGTFERLVRGVFLQRRKTLLNALRPVADSLGQSALEMIERAGVDPGKRPGALTIAEMARLSRAVL
jgi:16S rRNA (adenine1518-N6/adenine1519-N6)-dimethyltransferase